MISSFFSCRDLDRNALTGTIPPQISMLSRLTRLYAPKMAQLLCIGHICIIECWSCVECWSCAPLSQPFKELFFRNLDGNAFQRSCACYGRNIATSICVGSGGDLSLVLSELQPCQGEITSLYVFMLSECWSFALF